MRNHEVTSVQKLLRVDGSLKEPGWSRQLYQIYDRDDIKAPKFRIKEWDYYLVLCNDYALAFTISDDGYIGLQSVSLLDFRGKPWEHTETILTPFPMGKLHLPTTSEEGNTVYRDKRLNMEFSKTDGERRIVCQFKNFLDGKTLACDIKLDQPPMDTMVIATPWKENPKAFYYNQKINCMRASGYAVLGDETYTFSPETDFGTLDWGRGVWTYDNTWYWGSGNADIDGHAFGFNIGCGFGDTSAASENMLFYDGKCHKLDRVEFLIPGGDIMQPWKFTETNHRFEMDFVPIFDHRTDISALIISQDAHQVFGRLCGTAVLDDGTEIQVQNKLVFAERVHNRY